MNFPIGLPIYQLFNFLVNTPGVGSVLVALAGIGSITGYFITLKNIRAAKDEPGDVYTFPTPSLHDHSEE